MQIYSDLHPEGKIMYKVAGIWGVSFADNVLGMLPEAMLWAHFGKPPAKC